MQQGDSASAANLLDFSKASEPSSIERPQRLTPLKATSSRRRPPSTELSDASQLRARLANRLLTMTLDQLTLMEVIAVALSRAHFLFLMTLTGWPR